MEDSLAKPRRGVLSDGPGSGLRALGTDFGVQYQDEMHVYCEEDQPGWQLTCFGRLKALTKLWQL